MAHTPTPVDELNDLIKGIDLAILTTVHSDGALHSCPMATEQVDADGVLWFLTGSNTAKVDAVRFDHHVNVSYANPGEQRYVSISGACELVRDSDKTRQLWKPLYQTWFPKGLEDPNLILLKVRVVDVEYWSAPEGRMVQLLGFATSPDRKVITDLPG